MAKFRFIGQYTGGRESISCHGVTFYGNEPADVDGEEALRRLSGNTDFEEVKGKTSPPDIDGDGAPGGSPKGLMSTAAVGARKKRAARKAAK
jgi:hypothetical protein